MHFDCLREKMLGNKSFTPYKYLIPMILYFFQARLFYKRQTETNKIILHMRMNKMSWFTLTLYLIFQPVTWFCAIWFYGELSFCEITFWSYTNITDLIGLTTAFEVSLLDLIMELGCTYFLNLYIHFVVKKD